MKPEKVSWAGSTGAPPLVRGRGEGASRRNSFRKGSTPKLVSAEPKNTGLKLPVFTASMSKS